MNESNPASGHELDTRFERQLDRLVDGELDLAQRRELLAWCDERSDGWRRCALAFLEAQAWSADLTVAAPAKPALQRETVAAQAPTRLNERTATRWALAACMLAAIGVGWTARQMQLGFTLAAAPESPARVASVEPSASDTDPLDISPGEFESLAPAAPETVTLVMHCGEGGEQRQIELPVLATSDDDLEALRQVQPVVSAELQTALVRMGYRVEERRRLAPLVLEDGRQLVVPVDEVEFLPLETSEFQ